MGTECCRVKKDSANEDGKLAEDHRKPDENGKKAGENGKKSEDGRATENGKTGEDGTQSKESDAFAEPIFPPALMKYPILPLRLVGNRVTWYRPLSLASLLQLKLDHPDAKLVVGNTEIGIEMKFKNALYPVIIAPTHVPELCGIVVGESGVEVGASVTINDLRAELEVIRGGRGRENMLCTCYLLFICRKYQLKERHTRHEEFGRYCHRCGTLQEIKFEMLRALRGISSLLPLFLI